MYIKKYVIDELLLSFLNCSVQEAIIFTNMFFFVMIHLKSLITIEKMNKEGKIGSIMPKSKFHMNLCNFVYQINIIFPYSWVQLITRKKLNVWKLLRTSLFFSHTNIKIVLAHSQCLHILWVDLLIVYTIFFLHTYIRNGEKNFFIVHATR